MSSLAFRKRSGRIFWVASHNSSITARSAPPLPRPSLSESQIGDQQPSRPFNFPNSVQSHEVPDSASPTTFLRTSKTPPRYHTLGSQYSGAGPKHGVLSSVRADSRRNISGSYRGSTPSFLSAFRGRSFWHSSLKCKALASGYNALREKNYGLFSVSLLPMVRRSMEYDGVHFPCSLFRCFATATANEPSTSDGLTVEGIIAKDWNILNESENDWKSHAAAIAQSIHLIKKRLQVLL